MLNKPLCWSTQAAGRGVANVAKWICSPLTKSWILVARRNAILA